MSTAPSRPPDWMPQELLLRADKLIT